MSSGDKWRAVFATTDVPNPINTPSVYSYRELRLERNTTDLDRYSPIQPGHAMIYARNDDPDRWWSICVLPVDSGMTVRRHCFGGSNNVIYVPPEQSGTGSGGAPVSKPVSIFNNGNIGGVANMPTRPTVVRFDRPVHVAKITTYHWNYGQGTRTPGTIALRDSNGRIYGPWRASGSPGQGGVPNAYWAVMPNLDLPAGAYTIIDSDPSTWAQNSGSGGAGHAWIDGVRR